MRTFEIVSIDHHRTETSRSKRQILLLLVPGIFATILTIGGGLAWGQAGEERNDQPPPSPRAEHPADEIDRPESREGEFARPPGRDGDRRGMRREMKERRDRIRGGDHGRRGRGEHRHAGRVGGGDHDRGGRIGWGGRYLELVQSYQTAVQDPHQAIGLAVMGMKDFYRREGRPLDAIKDMEEILEDTRDQRVRNIVLFGMRQVYEDEREGKKVNELNKRIIEENIAAAEKRAN